MVHLYDLLLGFEHLLILLNLFVLGTGCSLHTLGEFEIGLSYLLAIYVGMHPLVLSPLLNQPYLYLFLLIFIHHWAVFLLQLHFEQLLSLLHFL